MFNQVHRELRRHVALRRLRRIVLTRVAVGDEMQPFDPDSKGPRDWLSTVFAVVLSVSHCHQGVRATISFGVAMGDRTATPDPPEWCSEAELIHQASIQASHRAPPRGPQSRWYPGSDGADHGIGTRSLEPLRRPRR